MSDIYIQSKWPGVVKGSALCVHRIKDRRFWASVSPPVRWGLVLCDSNVRVHVERMKAILRSLPTSGYCAAMGTLGGNKPSCLINLTTSSKFLRDCLITWCVCTEEHGTLWVTPFILWLRKLKHRKVIWRTQGCTWFLYIQLPLAQWMVSVSSWPQAWSVSWARFHRHSQFPFSQPGHLLCAWGSLDTSWWEGER